MKQHGQQFSNRKRERSNRLLIAAALFAPASAMCRVMLIAVIVLCVMCASARRSNAFARSVASSASSLLSLPGMADYEGRTIASIEVAFEGSAPDATAQAEFQSLLKVAPNTVYSTVRVRESLQALYESGRVASVRVEALDTNAPGGNATDGARGASAMNTAIRLRFVVRRAVQVKEVLLDIAENASDEITEDALRSRLTMLEPGARVTEQTLQRNADEIQTYLRDRGFFRATVEPSQQLDQSGVRATVTFRIVPNEQARVAPGGLGINIRGFDPVHVRPDLELQPNAPFSRTTLNADIVRLRQAMMEQDFLAPQLNDPQVTLDSANNTVTVGISGAAGPKVSVSVRNEKLGKKAERELLPVEREGTIDFSAITEGARRLRNRLQQQGYFFADANASCAVAPPVYPPAPDIPGQSCANLNAGELTGRTVQITYDVERGRRFKLTDIRIEGTNKISYDDVAGDLRTQKATALGIIPLLGYGRGYTSNESLAEDRQRLQNRMADLGYRRAVVEPRQGVSLNGEDLIITFVVTEGPLTRVAGVDIRGNQIYTASRLRDELTSDACQTPNQTTGPIVIGAPYSRTQARRDSNCILNFYARNGYVDARVDFSTVELPPAKNGDEQVRLLYTLTEEGDKVFVGRVLVDGNNLTKREAILRQLPFQTSDILRADKLNEGERNLYNTDAFRQVTVRTENAGETAAGFKKRDVIIDIEERKPRLLTYGGGYSTDTGAEGIFEISNQNLFGRLRQGALRFRGSQRQQLAQFEYIDPRFASYGNRQFAPLSLSAQYQRDTRVTRFFRSTVDQGNNGIVQRLDQKGNPVQLDAFGNLVRAGEPTINRFSFNVETSRDLELVTNAQNRVQKRSTILVRYNYEDVRLFKINSLLIAPILQPDRSIQLSRVAATLLRDTRDDPLETTRGDYLTVDYALALRQFGSSFSFNKFQSNYRRYYKVSALHNTLFAGQVTLGLANIIGTRPNNNNNLIVFDSNGFVDDFSKQLPISERFFSGGSTTLRGFGFQEAGPRFVVFPKGQFFDQKGKPVQLNPFTIPIGGNALAVINLEARIPVTKDLGVVPFYDGGNVFRRVSDIFKYKLQPGDNPNLVQRYTNTVGLGLRIRTPIGGSVAVDYGFLLNPPRFIIPQADGPSAIYQLPRTRLHFRFSQTF